MLLFQCAPSFFSFIQWMKRRRWLPPGVVFVLAPFRLRRCRALVGSGCGLRPTSSHRPQQGLDGKLAREQRLDPVLSVPGARSHRLRLISNSTLGLLSPFLRQGCSVGIGSSSGLNTYRTTLFRIKTRKAFGATRIRRKIGGVETAEQLFFCPLF